MRPRAAQAHPSPAAALSDTAWQLEFKGRRAHGQRKPHLAAAAGGAADRKGAAVSLDDALDDVEPEAGAAALAAPPEAGEDAVHGLLRDAWPLVAHRDRRAGFLALTRGSGGHDVNGDGSLAVPHRIFQQVAEHLVDL